MATRRELFAGEVLYRQGDPSDCAWLIERGAIELTRDAGPAHDQPRRARARAN